MGNIGRDALSCGAVAGLGAGRAEDAGFGGTKMTLAITPFTLAAVVFISLTILSQIMLAPPRLQGMILIGMWVVLPLTIVYGPFLHDYIQVPEKSTLQVYEGKIYFSTKRKQIGAFWKIVDQQGKSHTLLCGSRSFDMGGCLSIEKKDFGRYSGKHAVIYYSDKFGILEASIDGEEIYNYDKRKKWFTSPPDSIDYAFIWTSVIGLAVFIMACFKNFSLLASFFSNPLRWRRQQISRLQQLANERSTQDGC
jgi:hypothetical protein